MTYEERLEKEKTGELVFDTNYPGGAFYEESTDTHYNHSGQRLRPIGDYYPDEDGCYEPFGDEGDWRP